MSSVSLQIQFIQIQLVCVFNFLLLIHFLVSIGFILMVQHVITILIIVIARIGTTFSVRLRHGNRCIIVALVSLGHAFGVRLPLTITLIRVDALQGTGLNVLRGNSRIFLDFLSRIINRGMIACSSSFRGQPRLSCRVAVIHSSRGDSIRGPEPRSSPILGVLELDVLFLEAGLAELLHLLPHKFHSEEAFIVMHDL